MDSISTKILEARSVREKMEEQLRVEQETQAAALKERPEFKRLVRVTDARLRMYRTFKERCELIQQETASLPKNERLTIAETEIDPAAAIVQSPNVVAWTVKLNEASLCIETDPAGYDEDIDFFGSITLLGKYSARQTFWVSPKGTFLALENAGEFVPPSDYYSLRAALNSGAAVSTATTFEALLERGLKALVDVALEDRLPPKGWASFDAAVPGFIRMMHTIPRPKDVTKSTYEELGADVSELKRLAGVVPAAASQA